jgi:hypothetical protein
LLSQRALWDRVARFLRPGDIVLADLGRSFFGAATHRLAPDVTGRVRPYPAGSRQRGEAMAAWREAAVLAESQSDPQAAQIRERPALADGADVVSRR